jgi:hypothetical protein
MVYDKKRSGDPDYDDKVPADQHAAKVVRAGDGREVIMTESVGPVNPDGTHADIHDPAGDEGDHRPAPGDVATEPSTVQTYTPEDGPQPKVQDVEDLDREEAQRREADGDKSSSDTDAQRPVDAPKSEVPSAPRPTGRRTGK